MLGSVGSPRWPGGHEQKGLWLIVWQVAFEVQNANSQGSLHLFLPVNGSKTQAKLSGHRASLKHWLGWVHPIWALPFVPGGQRHSKEPGLLEQSIPGGHTFPFWHSSISRHPEIQKFRIIFHRFSKTICTYEETISKFADNSNFKLNILKGSLDPFTFSENSNYERESLLEV